MCAQFIRDVPSNWTAFAETGGWDILLVRGDGFQVGVQAKLRLNIEVINQAIRGEGWERRNEGPDCIAVLAPRGAGGERFAPVCDYIGLAVILIEPGQWRGATFHPPLPDEKRDYSTRPWHELCPLRRHTLPEYLPDVAAGVPSPIRLTRWKIGAIKLAIILETRGFLTRADFRALHIDHRRWIAPGSGWLLPVPGGWRRGPGVPDFRQQHPVVYARIAAEAGAWMPRDATLETQGALLL